MPQVHRRRRHGRARRRRRMLGPLLAWTAVGLAGCDVLPTNPAELSLGLGLVIGRLLGPPLGLATETRRCFQGERQIPCPATIPTN